MAGTTEFQSCLMHLEVRAFPDSALSTSKARRCTCKSTFRPTDTRYCLWASRLARLVSLNFRVLSTLKNKQQKTRCYQLQRLTVFLTVYWPEKGRVSFLKSKTQKKKKNTWLFPMISVSREKSGLFLKGKAAVTEPFYPAWLIVDWWNQRMSKGGLF